MKSNNWNKQILANQNYLQANGHSTRSKWSKGQCKSKKVKKPWIFHYLLISPKLVQQKAPCRKYRNQINRIKPWKYKNFTTTNEQKNIVEKQKKIWIIVKKLKNCSQYKNHLNHYFYFTNITAKIQPSKIKKPL